MNSLLLKQDPNINNNNIKLTLARNRFIKTRRRIFEKSKENHGSIEGGGLVPNKFNGSLRDHKRKLPEMPDFTLSEKRKMYKESRKCSSNNLSTCNTIDINIVNNFYTPAYQRKRLLERQFRVIIYLLLDVNNYVPHKL